MSYLPLSGAFVEFICAQTGHLVEEPLPKKQSKGNTNLINEVDRNGRS